MINTGNLSHVFRASPFKGLILLPNYPEFTIAAVTNNYLKSFEKKESDVLNTDFFEIFEHSDLGGQMDGISRLRVLLQTTLQSGKPGKLEGFYFKLKKDDCTLFEGMHVDVEIIPVLNENDLPGSIILSFKETENKTAADRPEYNSNQYYRSIVENSLNAFFLTKPDGTILEANQAAIDLFGYTLEELRQIGREGIIDHTEGYIYEKIKERSKRGWVKAELVGVKKSGVKFPIEVSSLLFSDLNGEQRTSTTISDISQRKTVEQELLLSEKKYKALFEDNPMPMFIWDFETRNIIDCNEEALIKYGYTREEFLQLNIRDIRPKEDIRLIDVATDSEAAYGRIHKEGWRHLKKNGEVMQLHITGHLMDYNGRRASLVLLNDITEKNRLEDLLNKSNRLAAVGSWEIDVTNGTVFWSDITKEIREVDPDFVPDLATGISYFKEGESRETISNLVKDCIEKGTPWDEELRILTHKGKLKWIRTIGEAEMVNGKCVKVYGSFQDIDERKKSAIKLAESENRFRTILEAEPEWVKLMGPGEQLLMVNPAGLAMIEADNEAQVIGKTLSEIILPEHMSAFSELTKNVFRGESGKLVFEIKGLKGTRRWMETHAVPLKNSQGICISLLGVTRDITERKKAEEEIRDSEEKRRLIMNGALDAIICIDTRERITFWNPQAEVIFGWKESEVMGQQLSELIIPEPFRRYHTEGIKHYLKTGEGEALNVLLELKAIRQTGEEFPIELTVLPVKQEGSEVFFCAFIRDISERKKNEDSLKQLNETLAQNAQELAISNKELEQFSYVASHDLQEPLRMVTSFLGQLEKKYSDSIDDKGKQYIHFAVDGAIRMRQIIQDLLEFSRVGRLDEEMAQVNINELLSDVISLYTIQIEESKTKITAEELPVIKTHKTPLFQVFHNLIGNALKYRHTENAPEIEISCTEIPGYWKFSVKDNGIGISKENFEKIFVIFQRLHNKNEYTGTGIGLAIVNKIINSLDGKIWVESEEGKGTVFHFTLPR